MGRRRQHSKGKHRPREWHMGIAQGRINERLLKTEIEPEFARADADQAEVRERTSTHRARQKDYDAMIDGLAHTAPFVPRLEVGLWTSQ